MIKFYRFLTSALKPVIYLYLLKRKFAGKEDSKRFKEKFGKAATSRPKGKLIWIHGASVGESLSALPLIDKISKEYPDINILLTTGTVSSAKLVANKLPNNAIHQFIPVDTAGAVKKFLNHWSPDLSLWLESELWPNLLSLTSQKCPIITINARMSDASFKKWQRFPSIAKTILNYFDLTLAQSQDDANKFKKLGTKKVKYLGNIKYGNPALEANPKKMGELITQIGDKTVFLAASTHSNEEYMIAKIHKSLKEKHPQLFTIIVPRHPKRTTDILNDISDLELNVSVRKKKDKINENTDIYIANTMGELGIFYRLSTLVFIGGSLVPHGGQNLLEPAKLDCVILLGKHTFNFAEITNEFLERKATIQVNDDKELKNELAKLLENSDLQQSYIENSKELVSEKYKILDNYFNELSVYINKINS